MKQIFLCLLFSTQCHSLAKACRFEGQSLSAIKENKKFKVEDKGRIAYPRELIRSQVSALGDMSVKECSGAFYSLKMTDLKDGETFTAFFSNSDECDGGNSYGVIVKGLQPVADNTIATIEDSDFWCL